MLSLLALLYSAYFINNPNINLFMNTLLIHIVVIIGYYIKWKIDEPSTFYMHVFWIIPITIYAETTGTGLLQIYTFTLTWENIYMFIFLCNYSFIQGYIYTKRVPGIDNSA